MQRHHPPGTSGGDRRPSDVGLPNHFRQVEELARVRAASKHARIVADRILSDLQGFGATRAQLVDLAQGAGPQTLPYLDLMRAHDERPPVVFEVHGQPRAYIFAAESTGDARIARWIRRIAFRGDADVS